jgi:TolB-like protein/Flp pilus assembly protein TadD
MPDIFLSYTREDQATAQRFAEAFEAQGFSVWWDVTLRLGEAYDQVTEEALEAARAVVVLWSNKSVVSRWVRAEATLADRNGTLVPAMIEPCKRPIMFELTQTADLCQWNGDARDPAWRAFLADVRRFVETEAARTSVSALQTAPAKPPPRSARPSIAILPFINRSGTAEDDAFAEGMAEDFTAAFSVHRWMKVVAASASAESRKGARDLRQIGRDLGVRYLLEGNTRRVGEHVRVTAQLVEAESGAVVCIKRLDHPLAEISALQEELVAEIANQLAIQIRFAERQPLSQFNNPSRSGWEAAVTQARRAVEVDPNDGPAFAELASSQGQLLHYLGGDDAELTQEILDNVRRARALDPDHPAVLTQCAGALIGLGRAQEALPFVERAVAEEPDHVSARFILGSVLARLGRSDEALEQFDAVERLAPNTVWRHRSFIWRSVAHLQAGRLDEALEAADRALRLVLGPDPLVQSMLCLAKLNRWDRAGEALLRLRESDPEMSRALVERLVRHIYGGADGIDDCVAIARKVWDQASSEANSP